MENTTEVGTSTAGNVQTPRNQSLRHPHPQLMTRVIKKKKIKVETKAACGLCCHQQGGCVFRPPRTQLVFLQDPGFKELQAFLHRQAFLQTLGRDEGRRKRAAVNSAARSQARVQAAGRQGAGRAPGENRGHAKERPPL